MAEGTNVPDIFVPIQPGKPETPVTTQRTPDGGINVTSGSNPEANQIPQPQTAAPLPTGTEN